MTITLAQAQENDRFFDTIRFSLIGCGLITLCSLVKIPLFPVPFTLQTFAISILALTQSPKQAYSSVICYLLLASLGFPVLCGHANPFWILGKSGGYLAAFPIAAYVSSSIAQKSSKMGALLVGQFLIYLMGFIWLVPFFGATVALTKGVLLFIPADLLKNVMALSLVSAWKRSK